jgi:molybdopterin converting factor small subunit
MSVKINVYHFLPHLTNDQEIVEVEGNTIGECLEHLASMFPAARRWLFGEDGNLSHFLNIYINKESALPEELNKSVKDGDEIFIVMMMTAG